MIQQCTTDKQQDILERRENWLKFTRKCTRKKVSGRWLIPVCFVYCFENLACLLHDRSSWILSHINSISWWRKDVHTGKIWLQRERTYILLWQLYRWRKKQLIPALCPLLALLQFLCSPPLPLLQLSCSPPGGALPSPALHSLFSQWSW